MLFGCFPGKAVSFRCNAFILRFFSLSSLIELPSFSINVFYRTGPGLFSTLKHLELCIFFVYLSLEITLIVYLTCRTWNILNGVSRHFLQ